MAHPSPIPALAPRPGAFDFFTGLSLPFRGLALIFRSPKLFLLTAISAVVTFASLVALVWLLAVYTDDLLSALWSRPTGWLALSGWYVALALTFLVLLVTGANTVPLAVQAPLQDPMSEATEELCGGFAPPRASAAGFARGLLASLVYTLARIALLLLGHAALLLLNLIPGIGSVLWSLAATAWTILWAAVEYLGAPMARHLYPFSAVRRVVRARLAAALGFGCAVYVVLWVPLVNLFFIPMAVVGGTLLVRGLRAAGALGPPPAPAR